LKHATLDAVLVIGIMPQEKIRERVLAIARWTYKPKPGRTEDVIPRREELARRLLGAGRRFSPQRDSVADLAAEHEAAFSLTATGCRGAGAGPCQLPWPAPVPRAA
jgi:hypothetical protein